MKPFGVAASLAALLVAGCLGPEGGSSTLDMQEETAIEAPRVVIALIDTGVNPWHDIYRTDVSAFEYPPGSALPLPQGLREALVSEGLSAWNALESDTVYHAPGTRLLATSMLRNDGIMPVFDDFFPPDPHRVYDDVNHGTATSSVVIQSSRNAWVLMIETDAFYEDAIRWAGGQPWIDIISISRGNLGHIPTGYPEPDMEAEGLLDAVNAGKLVVNAGGNTPDPNLMTHTGAPWVISVGGAEGDRQGVSPLTSQPVDVVANFTWHGLARNSSDTETFSAKGTSFGSPLVAAVLGEALYELRARYGNNGAPEEGVLVHTPQGPLTNRDFRWALNLTARYWGASEWDPAAMNLSQSNAVALAYEVTNPALPHVAGTPVGPWVQMGWGFVDTTTAADIVALLAGEVEAPEKRDAAAYMGALYAARSAVWDAYQGG